MLGRAARSLLAQTGTSGTTAVQDGFRTASVAFSRAYHKNVGCRIPVVLNDALLHPLSRGMRGWPQSHYHVYCLDRWSLHLRSGRSPCPCHVLADLCRDRLQVVEHYEKPRNVGSFDKNDINVGTGLVGAPACGDVMKLQIRVDDDGNIVDSCFKTFGCGSAIASSSVATEW